MANSSDKKRRGKGIVNVSYDHSQENVQIQNDGNVNAKSIILPLEFDERNQVIKKVAIAGGCLDLALFSSNVQMLKKVIDDGPNVLNYYKVILYLVISSLILQVGTKLNKNIAHLNFVFSC